MLFGVFSCCVSLRCLLVRWRQRWCSDPPYSMKPAGSRESVSSTRRTTKIKHIPLVSFDIKTFKSGFFTKPSHGFLFVSSKVGCLEEFLGDSASSGSLFQSPWHQRPYVCRSLLFGLSLPTTISFRLSEELSWICFVVYRKCKCSWLWVKTPVNTQKAF